MRDQTSYGGEGAVKSNYAAGRSLAGSDERELEQRKRLWGDVRDSVRDVPQVYECPRCGKDCDGKTGLASHQRWCGTSPEGQTVSPEKRRAIYYQYWTTEYSQNEVARHFGVGQRTVSNITDRRTHLRGQTEEVAEELGYPEEKDWPNGQSRKIDLD